VAIDEGFGDVVGLGAGLTLLEVEWKYLPELEKPVDELAFFVSSKSLSSLRDFRRPIRQNKRGSILPPRTTTKL
jgi:hypothetical protein